MEKENYFRSNCCGCRSHYLFRRLGDYQIHWQQCVRISLELSGYSASLALHHCADVLYGVSSLQNLSQTDKHQ